jgi:hypothetical protein
VARDLTQPKEFVMGEPGNGLLRRWRAVTVCGAFVATASQVFGQAAMPTDIDLRSAYCLPIVTNAAAHSQDLANQYSVAAPITEADARLNASLAKTARERQDDLSRLQAYLIPKLTLDSTALALAMSRGQTDLGQIGVVGSACGKQCPGSEPPADRAELDRRLSCMDTCFGTYPEIKRVRSCFPVNWLPF